MSRLSISALAKKLELRPDTIFSFCKDKGLPLPDVSKGDRGPKGYLSAGAAETIRQWHKEGKIIEAPRLSSGEANRNLVQSLVDDAHRERHGSGVPEFIIQLLVDCQIDPLSNRGKRLLRQALVVYFETFGPTDDFNGECERCGRGYRAAVTSEFVDAWVEERAGKRQRSRLSLCEACGGYADA